MKTISLVNLFLGKKIEAETRRYLSTLAKEKTTASRRETHEFLGRMQSALGRKVVLGETTWGEPVAVPLETILRACAIFTGGMGAGKTQASLLIFEAVLDAIIAELMNE